MWFLLSFFVIVECILLLVLMPYLIFEPVFCSIKKVYFSTLNCLFHFKYMPIHGCFSGFQAFNFAVLLCFLYVCSSIFLPFFNIKYSLFMVHFSLFVCIFITINQALNSV